MSESTTTTTPTEIQPGESPADFAQHLGIILNRQPLPKTKTPEPEPDGPPIELLDHQRTGEGDAEGAAAAYRVEALAVADELETPGLPDVDGVVDWIESLARDRVVIKATGEFWQAERDSRDLSTGSVGSLKGAKAAVERGLKLLPKLHEAAAAERARVDADRRLSKLGQADEHEKIDAALATAFASALKEPIDTAIELVGGFKAANVRKHNALREAPKRPTTEQRLLDQSELRTRQSELQTLTIVARVQGNDDRMVDLIGRLAQAGNERLAAAALRAFALAGHDPLKIRLAGLRLRQHTDARRTLLVGNADALRIAVALSIVNKVQAGLPRLRSFIAQNPRETSLAKQELDKLFRGLEI
jgi:hypothetical protein